MSSTYIELNPERFDTFFYEKGFTKDFQGSEIVYYRRHHINTNVIIKVYSSISVSSKARGCGGDAIRVVAIFAPNEPGGTTYPLYKGARVHRTGSQTAVEERTLQRMREAYVRCNEWIKKKK